MKQIDLHDKNALEIIFENFEIKQVY